MGWFDAWFDPDYVPQGNPRALMRMAVKAKTTLRRRRAIYGLAYVACDDEMFALPRYATDEEGTLQGRWLKACEAEAPERRAALRTVLASAGGSAEGAAASKRRRGDWARDLLAMIG